MKKTLTLLVASTALTAVIGTTGWSAMATAPNAIQRPLTTLYEDGAKSLPVILASDDDGDDDDENHGARRDHGDDDHDEDCEDDDDDDDCIGGAPDPATAGTAAPPQNGLFGNGAPPQAQVN
ncbi:hypothetical protein [Yoonia vestfoldensis]|uniref:hypothetical protein n=1 Tax=Yoonia vestfoldensis TaxID=245188 RepID=UPI0003812699|nr:hypothetical protein [Yoonia vestfoldensis]